MIGTTTLSKALVLVGACLLVGPALFPVQPVLYHDVGPGTTANETELEAQGYEVIAYENLSARGQELYVQAAERRFRSPPVALDQGAPEFEYPELNDSVPRYPGEVPGEQSGEEPPEGYVVIERPTDSDLPEAHEPVYRAGNEFERHPPDRSGAATPRPTPDQQEIEERREQIARYDMIRTYRAPPPLNYRSNLYRLLSAAVGIVFVGLGGYVYSRP